MATGTDEQLAAESADLPASPAAMDDVHAALDRFWSAVQAVHVACPDGRWRGLFDSTVAEIAANIVRHAYPPEQTGGRFRLELRGFPDRMEAELSDNGVRFEPPPAIPEVDFSEILFDADHEGGWGLPIAWAAVDRLEYERTADGRNSWRIEKLMGSGRGG